MSFAQVCVCVSFAQVCVSLAQVCVSLAQVCVCVCLLHMCERAASQGSAANNQKLFV